MKYMTKYRKYNPIHIIKNNISRVDFMINQNIYTLNKYMQELEYNKYCDRERKEAIKEYVISKKLTNSLFGRKILKKLLKLEWFREWLYKG